MEAVFTEERLSELRQLLKECVGLEVEDDDLYTAAISVVRYTAGKLLREASKESEV